MKQFILIVCLLYSLIGYAETNHNVQNNITFKQNGVIYCWDGQNDHCYVCSKTAENNPCEGKIVIPVEVEYEGHKLNVTKIEDRAFSNCENITSVQIPNSITTIPHGAFAECTNLTSVHLPDNLTIIEDLAFINCINLIEVNLPSSLKKIGMSAFMGCSFTDTIQIPNSITIVDMGSFAGCKNLTTIILGKDIDIIRKRAFRNSKGIKNITLFNPTPPKSDGEPFSDEVYMNATLIIPKGSLAAYQSDPLWNRFTNIVEE